MTGSDDIVGRSTDVIVTTGDAHQRAMTADSGIPIARSAAPRGTTPHEPNGESPPAGAPASIIGERGTPEGPAGRAVEARSVAQADHASGQNNTQAAISAFRRA